MKRLNLFRCLWVGGCVVILMASSIGCQKIQEKRILNGDWELLSATTPSLPGNLMTVLLPDYQENGCCRYLIFFKEKGINEGKYYRNDSLIYRVEGRWKLVSFNMLEVTLDNHVKGRFAIDRQKNQIYHLTTEQNEAQSLGNSILPLELVIRRL